MDFLFRQIPGHGRQSIPEEYGLNKENVLAFLEQRQPSVSAILSAVTESYMQKIGKHRWIEKTPNHILHLKAIRHNFPDAVIIRIVRDPRDVALSIIKTPWTWAPRTLVGALAMWRYMDDCSAEFFNSDKNIYTVKYEELITDPRSVLGMLCKFIGEDFDDRMLQKDQSYKQVNILNEPWKTKVAEKPDISRKEVWQRELDNHNKSICVSLIGDKLLKYGYSPENKSMQWGTIFPSDAYLRYPMLTDWLVAQKVRIWSTNSAEQAAVFAMVGEPEHDNWLGDHIYPRIINFYSILSKIISKKLSGIPIYWLVPKNRISSGILSRIVGRFIICFGSRLPVDTSEQPDINWRINLANYPKLASPDDSADKSLPEKAERRTGDMSNS